MSAWHAPIDPDCPKVARYARELFEDPMTAAMGAPTDEIMAEFESDHRRDCTRCQEFGVANMEVR